MFLISAIQVRKALIIKTLILYAIELEHHTGI